MLSRRIILNGLLLALTAGTIIVKAVYELDAASDIVVDVRMYLPETKSG